MIDSDLQQQLIQSIQRQLQTIDRQIQLARQLEHSLIGDLAKPVLHALHRDTQRLHYAKVALIEKLNEEEQKLQDLNRFDGQTASLFQESLQQLELVVQSIEILNGSTVDPNTGNYTFPSGVDRSWFTSKKSKDEKQKIALTNGMTGLNLPPEAQKYYKEIMKNALKNVPLDQWGATLEELNQLLLFDSEGNILRVLPVNMGAGDGVIILKNGVNDPELTAQANKELSTEQRELLNQSLLQLATGVVTALTGLGITGLDLAGTYFSGGTLALTGITQAGVVAGAATTGVGVAIVADAVSKMGVASSTVNYSFAQNYNDYSSKVEKMGPLKGNTPGNNQAQNKQVRDIVKKFKLNKKQQRQLHDEITGRGLSFQEILEIAEDIFHGK